jgi:hypothetical protein
MLGDPTDTLSGISLKSITAALARHVPRIAFSKVLEL